MRRLGLVFAGALLIALALPSVAFAQDATSPEDLQFVANTIWVMVAFVLVLFMQAGFAMLEVGFSRMKNVGSVVAKILANMGIGALVFWAVGFGLAFGEGNALFGAEGFFLTGFEDDGIPSSLLFLFQTAFALVSLAIVWGTMLERTKFPVYLIFAVVFVGLIYPVVAHWIWGGGWLSNIGKQDFAGSTVVPPFRRDGRPGGHPDPRSEARQVRR